MKQLEMGQMIVELQEKLDACRAELSVTRRELQAALSLDRWVSVEEALPEPGREVLTYGAKENWNGAVMYRYVGINRTEWYMRAPYDSEPLQCYTPTHWCEITPPNTKER